MRAKSGSVHLKKRKKVLKSAKGFRGGRRRLYRVAHEAVMKAGLHAFASRKQRKRHMRALWITRINAVVRPYGISYSRFIHNLSQAGVGLNRKMLADLAFRDPAAFGALVESTK